MKVLKGILSDSKSYYLDIKSKLERKIAKLPKGSVKERVISGKKYYYLQQRVGGKVAHKYLGKARPDGLIAEFKDRKALRAELKKVDEALKILNRAEGRKRG
jgi:hypothetical protein